MKLEELKALIASKHNASLAEQEGMVAQVWDDGEITYQKSGSLLWLRGLHCIKSGFSESVPLDAMPILDGNGSHSYCFVESDDAEVVRSAIEKYIKESDKTQYFVYRLFSGQEQLERYTQAGTVEFFSRKHQWCETASVALTKGIEDYKAVFNCEDITPEQAKQRFPKAFEQV